MPGSSPEEKPITSATEIAAETKASEAPKPEAPVEAKADGKTADSSAAEGAKEPETLADRLKKAVEQESKAGKSPDPEAGEEDEQPSEAPKDEAKAESDDDEQGDPTEDYLKRLKPKTRRRIERLLTERNERDAEIATLAPRAQAFDRLHGYMTQANLDESEVNNGFQVMAAMKNDPFKALELLTPYWNALLQATGQVLPADLKEKVDTGVMPEDAARELSRARARGAYTDARTQQDSERAQAQAEATRLQQTTVDVQSAVAAWESQWKASDPDYAKKSGRVLEKFELRLHKNRGMVDQTARQGGDVKSLVMRLANEARQDAEKEIKALVPQRAAITPVKDATSSASSRPKPTSTLEAIRAAVG